MCGHNSQTKAAIELEQRYDASIEQPEKFEIVYHRSARDYPEWPVITGEHPDIIQHYRWGLIPFFVDSAEKAYKLRTNTINCRSEEMWEKASFRNAVKSRRCLVPSTGFFEYKHVGKEAIPHFIYCPAQEVFSLAGIWDKWTDPSTGLIMHTFSILTTKANEFIAEIHNEGKRMPIILSVEEEKHWIDPDLTKDEINDLCRQCPEDFLCAHPVSKLISRWNQGVNTNVPEVQIPVDRPKDLFGNIV